MEPKTVGHWHGAIPVNAPVQLRAGIVHGTPILTLDGALPVEFLCPGDRIITRDTGMVRLLGVESFEASLRPVHVSPGALGNDSPGQAIRLHPAQQVHLRDWRATALFGAARALVRAEDLVDGEFIRRAGPSKTLRFTALTFERAEVIYAGGLELGCHTESAAIIPTKSAVELTLR
ncbi:Hint domain-containing protein [Pseudoruegeria sp. SHC-113]|uniref:Hint domain-containing protein n=1 Tax=Pseudoruegeria sp. SHC-113 TaxID=2855439 RepID=UPI0021BBA76C|nr:Hint domain-containing protein [Pseudoruegeria sp. SHC-113]MCT8160081.1 Hint domain-containing protein [Pseudoruegeria sp. SHC-113]